MSSPVSVRVDWGCAAGGAFFTMKKAVILLICAGVFLLDVACNRSTELRLETLRGTTMGTTYMVKWVVSETGSRDRQPLPETLRKGVKRVLDDINWKMSTYIPDSEISRFNQYTGTDWFPISEDLYVVLREALRISEISAGAFDVTVGPLVNLWGFGVEGRRDEIPSEESIRDTLERVGAASLDVRSQPPAVRKKNPSTSCDLAAIAKGYGVDRVAEWIESQGVVRYLVEIGGELRGRGLNHLDGPWRVGIATPSEGVGIQTVIPLLDQAMATSGDYRNYYEKDGIRYSHTIDPRTGRPVAHGLASITVIAETCTEADAMATALHVLGPERGREMAERQGIAAFFIVRREGRFIEIPTPAFRVILGSRMPARQDDDTGMRER